VKELIEALNAIPRWCWWPWEQTLRRWPGGVGQGGVHGATAANTDDAEALRATLQEVLNRGRDAALVTGLNIHGLTAETVHRMVAEYCAAGDEIWAVVPETEMLQGHPVLMGAE